MKSRFVENSISEGGTYKRVIVIAEFSCAFSGLVILLEDIHGTNAVCSAALFVVAMLVDGDLLVESAKINHLASAGGLRNALRLESQIEC